MHTIRKAVYPEFGYTAFLILKEFLFLHHRLTSQVYTQLLEDALVDIAQHHRTVNLATTELWQLFQSLLAVLIVL